MLVDINPNMELPKYDIVLCKMNKEEITELYNIEDKVYTNHFATIDEFTFNVPMLMSDNGKSIRNPIYDLVETDYLILLNNKQYFTIDTINEVESQDGSISKDIHAFSLEYELGHKMIVGYERVGRKLYTQPPFIDKDEDGFEIGILNYIETISSWKIGRVESTLWDKQRMLSFSSANLLQVFQELSKTFGCLFKFDTVNEIIDVLDIDNLGQNKGLYISDENFIKSINKNTDSKEVKTRLIVRGKDDLSINNLSITGQPYIENYNFYKNEKYMTKGLIDSLDRYDAFLESKQGVFEKHLKDIDDLVVAKNTLDHDLGELKKDLKIIENDIDIRITNSVPKDTDEVDTLDDESDSKVGLEDLKLLETKQQGLVDVKLSEIKTNENSQKVIRDKIGNLKQEIDFGKFLTQAQISEFDRFIKEDTFLDTNYTEENQEELLDEAKKILRKISQPKVTFDVDVFDFLSLVEFQHIWKKFISGDIVNLVHTKMNIDWEVRLINYVHDIDSNTLSLTFSNKDSIDDANMYIAELIENMNTTSTNVDFSKYKWNKGETADLTISKYIDSELDLAKQAILTAKGQRPILDDRGFWLYKENDDGSIDDKQMRLINNTLAITNDNWNTVSTAISGDGINAEVVRGKLGQFAKIQANQVEVIGGGNIKDYTDGIKESVDKEVEDLETAIENTKDYIDGAFKDGIISNAEAIAIGEHIKRLESEKADVDIEYLKLMTNPYLLIKIDLVHVKTNYNGSHKTLVDNIISVISDGIIEPSESVKINKNFTDLKNDMASLRGEMTLAFNQIQENYTNKTGQDIKEYTNGIRDSINKEVGELEGVIDSTNTYIDGAFKDGIITESELINIKQSLKTLAQEKADVDSEYSEIYYNTLLSSNVKTDLAYYKTGVEGYDKTHNELVALINTAISKKDVSKKESLAISGKFDLLTNRISSLRRSMTKAIDNIQKNYAETMKDEAIKHTDYLLGDTLDNLGDLAYEDMVERAKLGSSIVMSDGHIQAGLITADNIVTGTLDASMIRVGKTPWSSGTAIQSYTDTKINDAKKVAKTDSTNAENNAKKYTDDNAISFGNRYQSGIQMSASEGIEVFNGSAWNAQRVIQMGGISTTNNQSWKNDYGIRVSHNDGSFSAMTNKGFVKKTQHGDASYLNGVVTIESETTTTRSDGLWYPGYKPYDVDVNLPSEFRGKQVSISLTMRGYSIPISGYNNGQLLPQADIDTHLEVVRVITSSYTPYVTIEAYVQAGSWGGTLDNTFGGVQFSVTAIGK